MGVVDKISLGGTVYDVQDSAAVHYTAQELTDAQQAQARENIGAADALDTSDAMTAAGLVNYGYQAGEQSATQDGITAVRDGIRVVLNGTCTANYNFRVRMGGPIVTTNSTNPTAEANAAAYGVALPAGHTYKAELTLVSGTADVGSGSSLPSVHCYLAGTQSTTSISYVRTGNSFQRYLAGGQTVVVWIWISPGNVFTNAAYELRFYDITDDVTIGGSIAPVDYGRAANTHASGSLLTVNGQLYKATQAIATGETITPGTNVTETTVAAQLAERDTAISAVEADAEYIYMEPWQMMCKKYFITSGDGWFSVSGNRLVYKPTSSTGNVSVKVIVGGYASRSSTVSAYTPLISELVPVAVFGNAIKMGFYSSSDTSGRYPRLCYKFCTVSGDTVTPVSDAYGLVPDDAANNALAEEVVPVPEGATHVFFGVYFSGYYAGTYDMVYKVDKG